MSDIVFILGAGTSKQAGAPLMGNFLDVASDLLRSGRVNDKRPQFEQVFAAIGALQAVHSKAQLDLNNIESIFTVLELGKIIQRIPGIEPTDIPAAINALKELIVKTLEVTMIFPATNDGHIYAPKQYQDFAALLSHLQTDAFPQKTVSVISFNYDLGIDLAMYRHGLGPDYVLDNPVHTHNPVHLLKLHGSLNWATEVGSKKIYALHFNDYFRYYSGPRFGHNGGINVPISSQLTEYFSRYSVVKVESEPVIVPPSWNKADYHNALSDIWSAAAKHLSEAESIFVIGYSLPETDSFFRHLYALGSVGKTPLRRFQVFNPDTSGATDKRFQDLLGHGAAARYQYHPVTFDKAIAHIKELFPKRK